MYDEVVFSAVLTIVVQLVSIGFVLYLSRHNEHRCTDCNHDFNNGAYLSGNIHYVYRQADRNSEQPRSFEDLEAGVCAA